MTRRLVVLIAAALAMTGCGGDDDDGSGEVSEEAQPYVDALIASYDDSKPDELQLDRTQAECLAPRWVEVMRPERLRDAGIDPEEFADSDALFSELQLSEAEGGELYDAFVACDVDLRGLFIEGMAEGQEVSDADRECLNDAIDDDLLRRIMSITFVEGEDALDQDEELMGELFAVFSECPGAVQTD